MKKTLAIVTAVMMMFVISSAIATKDSSPYDEGELPVYTMDELMEMPHEEMMEYLRAHYEVYKAQTNGNLFD